MALLQLRQRETQTERYKGQIQQVRDQEARLAEETKKLEEKLNGLYEKAFEEINEAIEKFPDYPKLYIVQAQTVGSQIDVQTDYQQLIDLYKKAIELDDSDPAWHWSMAKLYWLKAQEEENPIESLEKGFGILRKVLYEPCLTYDLEGPRQSYLMSIKYGRVIPLLIEIGSELAQKTGTQQKREWYLEKTEAQFSDMRDLMGDDNASVKISDGTLEMAKGNIEQAAQLFYQADKQLEKEDGRVNGRLKLKLFKVLPELGYPSLAAECVLAAVTRGGQGDLATYIECLDMLLKLPGQGYLSTIETVLDAEAQIVPEGQADDQDWLRAKATALLRLGKVDQARQILKKVKGDSAEIRAIKAETIESTEGRLVAFEEIIKDHPDHIQTLSALIRYYHALGKEDPSKYDRARELIEIALKTAPDDERLMQVRQILKEPDPANVSQERMQQITLELLNQTKEPYERHIKLDRYYRDLGKIAQQQQQNDQAKKHWQKAQEHIDAAIKQKPTDKNAQSLAIELAILRKDWQQAEKIAGQAAKNDKYLGLMFEAELKMAKEQWDQAADCLERMLADGPLNLSGHIALARAYSILGRHENAISEAMTAVDQNRLDFGANLLLMQLIHQRNMVTGLEILSLGQIRDMMEPTLRILSVNSLHPMANRILVAYYPLMISYWAAEAQSPRITEQRRTALQKDIDVGYDQIIKSCRILIAQEPQNESNRSMLARLWRERAKNELDEKRKNEYLQQSREAYQEGLKNIPDSQLLQFAYALFLSDIGEGQQAEQMLGQVVDQAEGPEKLERKLQLARYYIKQQDHDKAEQILKEILAQNDKHRQSIIILAEILVKRAGNDNFKQAAQLYGRAREIEENPKAIARQIEILLMAGDLTQAEILTEKLAKEDPDSTMTYLVQSNTELSKANYAAAAAYADKALAKEPGYRHALLKKAQAMYYDQKWQQALECLMEIRSQEPTESNLARMELANVYWRLMRYDEAVQELETIISNDPQSIQARQLLAQRLQARKDWSKLKRLYDEALQIYPGDFGLHLEVAQVAINHGDYLAASSQSRQQARAEYSRAERLLMRALSISQMTGKGQLDVLLSNLVRVLLKQGRYQQVLKLTTENMQGNSSDALLLANKAIALYRMKREKEAISAFESAITAAKGNVRLTGQVLSVTTQVGDIDAMTAWAQQKLAEQKDWLDIHILLANLYVQKGQLEKDTEQLLEAKKLAKEPATLVQIDRLLARSYYRRGQIPETLKYYRQVLKERPDEIDILNNVAYLLLDQGGQEKEALEMAQRAYNVAGNDPDIMDTYALALMAKGQFQDAEVVARRAIQEADRTRNSVPVEFRYHLAQALNGRGRNREAAETLKQALEELDRQNQNAPDVSLKQKIVQMLDEIDKDDQL